jgi:dolichol-phosphate mannosyltransferase
MIKSIVIIPTYNEAENVINIINKVLSLPVSFDILIVDDNSPDGTASLVNELIRKIENKIYIINRPNKSGLGKAYKEGFQWALEKQYEYIFEMDADFSHDPNDLVRMFNNLTDYDVVIGSRYKEGINVVNWPLSRIILSYFASIYSRIITGMPVKDATSGFVGYKSKVLKSIDLKSLVFNGYAFQIELKFKSYLNKFKILEIPIIFKDRVYGDSKMNSSIIFEAIFGLITMRLKSFFKRL